MNAPLTAIEKLLSIKSGAVAFAGDTIVADVDVVLTNDASGPLSLEVLRRMEAESVAFPERILMVMDHYVPCPNRQVAVMQQEMLDFGLKHGVAVLAGGEGIAHRVLDELYYVRPGRLIVGGDSHTTAHGYLGSAGIGAGASDIAMLIHTGTLWLKVPETIAVRFTGKLSPNVCGKDAALYLLSVLGPDGANYRALEFIGPGLKALPMNDRRTLCNMMAESGAKCAIMPLDETGRSYCEEMGIPVEADISSDAGCRYERIVEIDLAGIAPQIAPPHSPANSVPLASLENTPIDVVVIGTCTNGDIEDFQVFDSFVPENCRKFAAETIAVPASRRVYEAMTAQGITSRLLARGAVILPPGCGPCCGSSPGVPRDGQNVLSTANRNYIGRMGNTKADIYLGSPASAAAAAVTGRIASPGIASPEKKPWA